MLQAVDTHTDILAPGLPTSSPVWTAAADPLTQSPRVLLFALETFGSERIVLGIDHPFKLAVDDPTAERHRLPMDPAMRRRLVDDNVRDRLRLPVAPPA